MAVSDQETVFPHVGNGVTVDFAYRCQIHAASDLTVFVDDVKISSGFSVSGIGNQTGGTVTFTTPPASGAAIRLERIIDLARATDYQQTGDFLSTVVNRDFDRLWMALQQHESALGVTPGALRRVLMVARDDQMIAELPNAAARADRLLGFNSDGQPVTVTPVEQSAGAISVDLASTAAGKGAAMIGFKQSGTGARARTVAEKSADWVSVSDFAIGNGTDETAAVQAAINYAVATSKRLFIDRPYVVSAVTVANASGLVIMSTGSLTGLPTGTYDAVLTIKNSADVFVVGRLPVSASYNSNYSCAVAIYTDNATAAAKMDLGNVIVVGAKVGWRIGRSTEVNALVSEITLRGGYSYGCPSFLEAYGTQTVVNIIGYQAISDTGANPGGWSSLSRIHTRSIGANVRYVGGECMLTDVATGLGFSIEPIADPVNGNQYGTIEALGVDIEFASQLFSFRNPGAVGTLTAGRGAINLSNCSGVHTQNSFAWGVSASDFTGSIRVQNCKFFCTTTRTQLNIVCSGSAHLYVDDYSFGTGFVQGLQGLSGGIAHYTRRKIFDAHTANQALPNATLTAVKYGTVINDEATTRFSTAYNAATGVFTVPTGGLKDVEVFATLHTTLPANPLDLCVYVNGAQRTPFPTSVGGASCNGWVGGQTMLGNLNAGDTVDVRATQSGGSASTSNGASFERFVIYARN